jgi:cytochrome c553
VFKQFVLATMLVTNGSAAWAESHATAAEGIDETGVVADEAALQQAEEIFDRKCSACHGNRAQGVASYPQLSDKDAAYLADKLATYRAGERIGPNSVLMIQNARDLSDEEIAGLSVYISTAFD